MLNNKSNIIEDDHNTKNKFNDIDLHIFSEDGFKAHLSERKEASC